MAEVDQIECPHCGGSGFTFEADASGGRVARRCVCQLAARNARALGHARIPRRYEHCTLEEYHTDFASANNTLKRALMTARKFVNSYPLETDGKGLLLTGNIGVGKTHLAVGVLQALIERGAQGLFFDYRELLKQIQHSYNDSVTTTEMGILEPIFNAEVLVLDEIGASKPTDWVWDTVSHILNSRYNDQKTTILTTNYANQSAGGVQVPHRTGGMRSEDTLGDRIGDRMWSRLQEMCVVVEMQGEDFRQKVKKAAFA